MQDEPEEGDCFSRRMSLPGERLWMLGVDHARASRKEAEPGADPGVLGVEPSDGIQGPAWGGGLRLGDTNAAGARIGPPGPSGQRAAASVPGEDDRAELGAGHAADRPVPASRRGARSPVATSSVSDSILAPGRGAFGGTGAGPRRSPGAGHAADTGARVQGVGAPRIGAAGGDLGGPDLPPAPAGRLAAAPGPLHQGPAGGGVDRGAAAARAARPPGLSARRHGAPGGSRRREGRLSHQRGR